MIKKSITLVLILSGAFGFFNTKGTDNYVFYALPLGATKESACGDSIKGWWGSVWENFENSNAPEDLNLGSDLGQQNCMKAFEDSYQTYRDTNAKDATYILAGTSQGTATIPNLLGQKSHEKQKEYASALFFESMLGSANNTLIYFVENMPNQTDWPKVKKIINKPILNFIKSYPKMPQFVTKRAESTSSALASALSFSARSGTQILSALTYLPFARTWIPYAAKIVAFPTYSPRGMQAIDSVAHLSPDIPVIIIHHKEDKKICIDEARRVYCKLCEKRGENNNVYLFEIENTEEYTSIDSTNHDAILCCKSDDPKHYDTRVPIIKKIQSIFKKHNIRIMKSPKYIADLSAEDLKLCQPSIAEVEQRIAANSGRKNFIRNVIDRTASAALFAGISYLAKDYITQACSKIVAY